MTTQLAVPQIAKSDPLLMLVGRSPVQFVQSLRELVEVPGRTNSGEPRNDIEWMGNIVNDEAQRARHRRYDPFSIFDEEEPDLDEVYLSAAERILDYSFPKGGDWNLALTILEETGAKKVILRRRRQTERDIENEKWKSDFERVIIGKKPGRSLSFIARRTVLDSYEALLLLEVERWSKSARRLKGTGLFSGLACELSSGMAPIGSTFVVQAGKRRFAYWKTPRPLTSVEVARASRVLFPRGAKLTKLLPLPGSPLGRGIVSVVEKKNARAVMPWSMPWGRKWSNLCWSRITKAKELLTDPDTDAREAIERASVLVGPLLRHKDAFECQVFAMAQLIERQHPNTPSLGRELFNRMKFHRQFTQLEVDERTWLELDRNERIDNWIQNAINLGREIKIEDLLTRSPQDTSRTTKVRRACSLARKARWTVVKHSGAVAKLVPNTLSPVVVTHTRSLIVRDSPVDSSCHTPEGLVEAILTQGVAIRTSEIELPPEVNRHAVLTMLGKVATARGWSSRRVNRNRATMYSPPATEVQLVA